MYFGFIYKTINLINNKVYIGQHGKNRHDKYYLGSGVLIRAAIKKYGKENFKRVIICYCDNQEELDKWERHFIGVYDSQNKEKGYNIQNGGLNRGKFDKISIQKMRDKKKGYKTWILGKHHSLETRKKMSESQKGKCNGKKTYLTKERIQQWIKEGMHVGRIKGSKNKEHRLQKKHDIIIDLIRQQKSRYYISRFIKSNNSSINKYLKIIKNEIPANLWKFYGIE